MTQRSMTLLSAAAAAALSASACTGFVVTSSTAAEPVAPCVQMPATPQGDGRLALESLGVTFVLPEGFTDRSSQDPTLAFMARSSAPPAVLTISCERPGLTNLGNRPGEQANRRSIDGIEVSEILGAQLADLPPGIEAAELYVDNGAQSFSAIMSADPTTLSQRWPQFTDSIRLTDHNR